MTAAERLFLWNSRKGEPFAIWSGFKGAIYTQPECLIQEFKGIYRYDNKISSDST